VSKRAQNKERKKAQIIEAATWLILKHGHADFTMPELALFVESGLSPYQTLVAATTEPARYFDASSAPSWKVPAPTWLCSMPTHWITLLMPAKYLV